MSPILDHESVLIDEIDRYTKKHGKMPTEIRGTFKQLLPICAFCNFTRFMGFEVFVTPLGHLTITLDTNADSWYLA